MKPQLLRLKRWLALEPFAFYPSLGAWLELLCCLVGLQAGELLLQQASTNSLPFPSLSLLWLGGGLGLVALRWLRPHLSKPLQTLWPEVLQQEAHPLWLWLLVASLLLPLWEAPLLSPLVGAWVLLSAYATSYWKPLQGQQASARFALRSRPWLFVGAGLALGLPLLFSAAHRTLKLLGLRSELAPHAADAALLLLAFGAMAWGVFGTLHWFVRQLHEQQRQCKQLENRSLTDPLTGLMNRRNLDEQLKGELARSQRLELPCCLALFDIDFFKRINDTYGHPCGDEVLQQLSTLIRGNLRQYDCLARYGGEEFALLLPNTRYHEAYQLMERLRRLVESTLFRTSEHPLKFTISIGLTEFDAARHTQSSFVQEADTALYAAKRNGRNQTKVFGLVGGVSNPFQTHAFAGTTPKQISSKP